MSTYNETEYLMSSEANAAHLMKSIAEAKSGNVISHDLINDEKNEFLGSNFDEFLEDEKILNETTTVAKERLKNLK